MRAFIVLCLIAFAAADSLPYNYGPVSHSDVGFGRGGAISSGDQGAASSDAGQIVSGGGAGGFVGSSVGAGGFGGSSIGAGGFVGSAGGDGGLQKEFYSFTANDAEFEPADASQQIESSVKRNLQVIFIKGPESHGLEHAALNLARHASEQRTAIYVLQKQADLGTLARRLNVEQSHDRQRPEVHFVKYRTPEDAQHAQHAIQSQYDQLGGSSSNYNGGVAPVINFASHGSSYSGSAGGAGGFGGISGGAGSAPVVSIASQGSSYAGSAGGAGGFGGISGDAGSAPVVSIASQGSSYTGSAGGAGGFGGISGGAGGFGAGSAPSANYLPASILRRH